MSDNNDGNNNTTNIDGNMNITIGNKILIGAFIACVLTN